MSGLVFTLREEPRQRVDMTPLTPDRIAGKSLADVGSIGLLCGNRILRADALFELSGSPVAAGDQAEITIKKSSSKLHNIGAAMTQGTIEIAGDAGAYVGLGMKGGLIRISGNAGAFAACAMRNGEIRISGNAGEFLGGALIGDRKGMRGGIVRVSGNAGPRAGDHLRRGILMIAGNADDYCGARMTAGTIIVLGQAGDFTGLGMSRGTILLTRPPKGVPPTFNDCGHHDLPFLRLLFNSVRGDQSEFAALDRFGNRVRRLAGDRGVNGLGEILIRSS